MPAGELRTHSHEELLTFARKVQAAALDHDPDRLAVATRRLDEALRAHVAAEAGDFGRLPRAEARSLAGGQARILRQLAGLRSRTGSSGPCSCADRAAGMIAQLHLQAHSEQRALATTH